jgi:uridine kinase
MQNPSPYIVGITGGSASGKTSFLHAISQLFDQTQVCILSQDNYYKPATQQPLDANGNPNFDLPECLELDAFHDDILLLKSGQGIRRREYRFQHEQQMGDWLYVAPAPILIIEGLFIFYRQDIASHFDLGIFIETDEQLQLERRLKRDMEERNIPEDYIHYQWMHHVMPAYREYLEPLRLKQTLSSIIM